MKYTLKDLMKVSVQYKLNMVKLTEAVGKREHIRYVREERRLNALDMQIRKSLGIFVQDPCPLTTTGKDCCSCTGNYKRIPYDLSTRSKTKTVMVDDGDTDAKRCSLKDIILKNFDKDWILEKDNLEAVPA